MSTLLQDLRYGLRMLAKSPGFTVVAVITLALGIGATTAIFTVVDGVLLRPLPYPHPERIVELSRTYRGQLDFSGFTAGAFDFWKEHSKPFAYLAASTPVGFNLAGAGRPERVKALRVSSDYFHIFGVEPSLGRDFSADEDRLGGPNVAILSHSLWMEHFGGRPGAIGGTILLDGTPYAVIGVMPAGFASTLSAQLWTTIGQVRDSIGGGQNYKVTGRLKAGVSFREADAYLSTLTRPFIDRFYRWMPERVSAAVRFVAAPYQYVLTKDIRTPLLALFGAIGFVLLIASVNVANLLMTRAAVRVREMALRTALGASRRRIFRQLLTESILLALWGGALGLLVAHWALESLLALTPPDLPHAGAISLDRWALAFTMALAVLTGILFGLAPALQSSHTHLSESLKEGSGRTTSSRGRRRLSGALVSSELALSLVLLVGCGLLIETFANLLRVNTGFDPHRVSSLQIWTAGSKFDSMPALAAFYESLLRQLRAVPGVEGAAVVAAGLPLETGGNANPGLRVGGQLQFPSVDYREVTPDYFRTLGVPVLEGRSFTAADSYDAAKVAMINAAFARQYFHYQNPVGHHVILDNNALEIVGVAGNVRSQLNEPGPPTFFVPMAQASYDTDQLFQGWFPTSILVRTAVPPLSLSRQVETVVRAAAPDVPLGHIRSMEEVLAISIAFQRFLMTLMSVFAGLALVLAAIGLYGVVSYSVTQRIHEIGIRMALGARRRDVMNLVLGQGMLLVLAGLAVGVAAALALTRLMASLLYGVRSTDGGTFLAVSGALIGVALVAAYIPALRATKVDPLAALRYE